MSAPGYSINPASTGAQGLEQYFTNKNKNEAGGVRAPVINIATGGSSLTPSLSTAQGSDSWTTYALIGAALVGVYIWKGKM